MPNTVSGADWPLIGRDEELGLLRQIRHASPPKSAVILGPSGVGKTRVAREALSEAARDGWSTLSLQGSTGMISVPLGPFRSAFRIAIPKSQTELTESVLQELDTLRIRNGLIVLVDDCHNLDEASIGLLHQSMAAGSLVTIMTMRTREAPHPALTDIWKDQLAERIELFNLSRIEAADLLASGLGGPVQDSSTERIWHLTSGNPLYLREVVLSSAETGALRVKEGKWRWRDVATTGSRLQEIVASRLGRLDADETTATELLSLAGALPLDLLMNLTSAGVVERLETSGLVSTQRTNGGLEVSMASPLQAEVVRNALPALRQRSLRHTLVESLLAKGVSTSADRVRIACWSLELGIDVDPISLSLGVNASLYGIDSAIARRIQEILPGVVPATQLENPAVAHDFDVAVALARTAFARTGELIEGVALASSLAWTRSTAEAEDVLARLSITAESYDDTLRIALARSWIQFWVRYEVDEARATLTGALESGDVENADASLLALVYEALAGFAFNTGNPQIAFEYAQRAATATKVELCASNAAPVAAAALAYLGRCGESLTLVDEALPLVMGADHTLEMAQLLVARTGALARAGDVEQARALIQWLRDVAITEGYLDSTAVSGVILGEIFLRQGRPAQAARVFADSSGLFTERDQLGYRPWALAGLARAWALVGDENLATAALEEARRARVVERHFESTYFLATVDVHSLSGRQDLAVQCALDGVAWAKSAGMIVDEALLLEVLFQIDPSSDLATRLGELANSTDSRLVQTLAAFARAAIDGDVDTLLDVSQQFAAMSTWSLAIDAAETAEQLLTRRGETRRAQAVSHTISELRRQCEGVYALDRVSDGVRLTRRESEIARLAVAGRSTREIAERLFLSPRTVENHLYHVYGKLGVTNRQSLATIIAPTPETE